MEVVDEYSSFGSRVAKMRRWEGWFAFASEVRRDVLKEKTKNKRTRGVTIGIEHVLLEFRMQGTNWSRLLAVEWSHELEKKLHSYDAGL